MVAAAGGGGGGPGARRVVCAVRAYKAGGEMLEAYEGADGGGECVEGVCDVLRGGRGEGGWRGGVVEGRMGWCS